MPPPSSPTPLVPSKKTTKKISNRPSGRSRLGFSAPSEEGEEPCIDGAASCSSSSSSSSPSTSSSAAGFSFDGRVTSVYFDEPGSLPALTSRGLRLDGASLVRARYYGRNSFPQQGGAAKAAAAAAPPPSSPSPSAAARKESDGGVESDGASQASTALSPPTVWLERKVHRDASSGKRSFKERVALTGAEAAALIEALPRSRSPSCRSACSPSSPLSPPLSPPLSSSPVSSLAAAALRVALGPGAVPLLRTEAERTAFEGEGGLRVTVDERVRMSAAAAGEGEGGRLFGDGGEGGEGARRLLFPFTIVEVKLAW